MKILKIEEFNKVNEGLINFNHIPIGVAYLTVVLFAGNTNLLDVKLDNKKQRELKEHIKTIRNLLKKYKSKIKKDNVLNAILKIKQPELHKDDLSKIFKENPIEHFEQIMSPIDYKKINEIVLQLKQLCEINGVEQKNDNKIVNNTVTQKEENGINNFVKTICDYDPDEEDVENEEYEGEGALSYTDMDNDEDW